MSLPRSSLWRHAGFLKLWSGQTVSQFGSLVGGLALAFTAILYLHATPLQVSLLAACQLAPGFVIGLVAGVWVDRLRRRPILIAADAGRALALGSVPLAAAFGLLRLEQVYLAGVCTSSLAVFFDAAYEAYLPTLVSREELVEGNSKLTASASVAEFGAFSLSGFLVQALTAPGAVLVDAASFVVSALSIWTIRAPEPPPLPAHTRRPFLHEVAEGLRLVHHDGLLRSLAVTNVMLQFSGRIVGTTILLYLSREAGYSPAALGVIFGIGGLTSLAGAAVAGRWSWFGGLGPALVLSVVMRAAGGAFIPLAGSVSLLSMVFLVSSQVVTDPAWSFYLINDVSLRQAITPERLQGRVSASLRVLDFGAMLLGTLAAGIIGQTAGLRPALIVAVAGTLGAGLWLALSPVSRLRTTPPPIEPEDALGET